MGDEILKFRAGDLHGIVLEQAAERDVTVSQFLRDAVTAFTDKPCEGCGECSVCGDAQLAVDTLAVTPDETAAIVGFGEWDTTTNPEVQALIDRAKELLLVGAVGVSVATDLEPSDLPTNPDDVTEQDIANARQRIRHVAIVDTPAFSGAFLAIQPDGTLSGPLVFEGEITGDIRAIGPVGTFNIDEAELPIPIIFDLQDGDHTGVVVGHINREERVLDFQPAMDNEAPVAASLDAYPAYLVSEPEPGPMTVSAPDAYGYRRYSGTIMPANVCHKGRGGCLTYKHKGFSLDYFHSGARIPLDDGTFTRVGPLMFGDLHADGSKMDYAEALERTNEDARTVFAMGRTFHHPKGLLFSGVLMPDADIMRVQATGPSVEIWPDHKGKAELKTALQVPRPALPVAASLDGGGVFMADPTPVVVQESAGEWHARMDALSQRLDAVEKVSAELFAAHLKTTL